MREGSKSPYIGRFAPTPSGALHLGSLTAALASWLDARAVGGRWLLRIEDIDPPREMPGAKDGILRTLEALGLTWDGPVVKQSTQLAAYREQAFQFIQQGLAYACCCSRKQLSGFLVYPGTCRNARHAAQGAAIRLRVPDKTFAFVDRVQGAFSQRLADEVGDFVIWRKDGLAAYQLAVVLDDITQGVTDTVRGADLLDSTPRQLYLYQLLGKKPPRYLHIPLLVQQDGRKLGKSFRSEALTRAEPGQALVRALRALGQCPPRALQRQSVSQILQWAVSHWRVENIPRVRTLLEPVAD
ncbi:glutamyl-Q tRNA(Asp) synthetase [Ventosimonas gracilis]|uniref:Glutamyl-Q tRNA(Asp) synthetase n=1 Tax=Ventosimonas gracilis TaxID=1680762 RepID=A0A139SSN7_9GAMM|nr:glutamyl-Q tRNA(Asp) synthetase [Ventosimonas gracilis]